MMDPLGPRATVSVVLPALNEEATVGDVVASIRPWCSGPDRVVDEILVLDSDSTDRTAERARAAGARVVNWRAVLPQVAPVPGKGEALWRGTAAARGDIVCFIDADLVDPPSWWVPALVRPLLENPGVELVKAHYRRPLTEGSHSDADGGGRVTELTARPLLAALRPELSGVRQPLGGEYAARRATLAQLSFAPGYGVEIGLLIDIAERFGAGAVAQVDLGLRRHRNRPLAELGPMARQVAATLLTRCGVADSGAAAPWFRSDGQVLRSAPSLADRPPLSGIDGALGWGAGPT